MPVGQAWGTSTWPGTVFWHDIEECRKEFTIDTQVYLHVTISGLFSIGRTSAARPALPGWLHDEIVRSTRACGMVFPARLALLYKKPCRKERTIDTQVYLHVAISGLFSIGRTSAGRPALPGWLHDEISRKIQRFGRNWAGFWPCYHFFPKSQMICLALLTL